MCLSREAVQTLKLAEKLESFGWSASNAQFYAHRYYKRRSDELRRHRALIQSSEAHATPSGSSGLRRTDDACRGASASE